MEPLPPISKAFSHVFQQERQLSNPVIQDSRVLATTSEVDNNWRSSFTRRGGNSASRGRGRSFVRGYASYPNKPQGSSANQLNRKVNDEAVLQFTQKKTTNLPIPSVWILDTGATDHVFCVRKKERGRGKEKGVVVHGREGQQGAAAAASARGGGVAAANGGPQQKNAGSGGATKAAAAWRETPPRGVWPQRPCDNRVRGRDGARNGAPTWLRTMLCSPARWWCRAMGMAEGEDARRRPGGLNSGHSGAAEEGGTTVASFADGGVAAADLAANMVVVVAFAAGKRSGGATGHHRGWAVLQRCGEGAAGVCAGGGCLRPRPRWGWFVFVSSLLVLLCVFSPSFHCLWPGYGREGCCLDFSAYFPFLL
ncbi:hypothetical protein SESBI_20512 [Sesbania bispinosa]|nr:hypothetical protein SESBI_20512 [Sesbania bispinosa]